MDKSTDASNNQPPTLSPEEIPSVMEKWRQGSAEREARWENPGRRDRRYSAATDNLLRQQDAN